MSDDTIFNVPEAQVDPDDVDVAGWLRWWHWLVLAGLLFAGFIYYPLWRFEQRWKQLHVGDSVERMEELLGDPGKASYTIQGTGALGADEAYVFTRYWKTYEVLVSTATQRVTAMSELGGDSPQAGPAPSTPRKR